MINKMYILVKILAFSTRNEAVLPELVVERDNGYSENMKNYALFII
jgi:hypothetical protein